MARRPAAGQCGLNAARRTGRRTGPCRFPAAARRSAAARFPAAARRGTAGRRGKNRGRNGRPAGRHGRCGPRRTAARRGTTRCPGSAAGHRTGRSGRPAHRNRAAARPAPGARRTAGTSRYRRGCRACRAAHRSPGCRSPGCRSPACRIRGHRIPVRRSPARAPRVGRGPRSSRRRSLRAVARRPVVAVEAAGCVPLAGRALEPRRPVIAVEARRTLRALRPRALVAGDPAGIRRACLGVVARPAAAEAVVARLAVRPRSRRGRPSHGLPTPGRSFPASRSSGCTSSETLPVTVTRGAGGPAISVSTVRRRRPRRPPRAA